MAMTYQGIVERIARAYNTGGLAVDEVRDILVDYRDLLTGSNSSAALRGAITAVLGDIAAGAPGAAETIDYVAAHCSTYERHAEILKVDPGAPEPVLIARATFDPYPVFDGLRFLYSYRTLGRVGSNISVLAWRRLSLSSASETPAGPEPTPRDKR